MVDWQALTWDDLAPLYNDTWQGPDAVQDLLGSLFKPLFQACRAALADERQTDHSSAAELANATYVYVVENLSKKEGMNRESNWQEKTPRKVFWKWAKSRARDCLRKGRQNKEQPLSAAADGPSPEQKLAALVEQSPWKRARTPADRELEVGERLGAVLEAMDAPGLKPGHRLACLSLRAPELLVPQHVDAAVAASTRDEGLARDAEQTWALLSRWRDRVVEPASAPSRVELAWIFFSRDDSSHEEWKKAHPKADKDGRDRLRQWDKRFRTALKKRMEDA